MLEKTLQTMALLTTTLIGLSVASAADLSAPIYKAPPMMQAKPLSWTGFYVGGNAGYGWGSWDSSTAILPLSTGLGLATDPHVDGWLGGVQAGYNWQVNSLLYGIEADVQITDMKARDSGATIPAVFPVQDGTLTISSSVTNAWNLPWFATFRGRIGFVSNDWMIYGTGGLAVGETKFSNVTTLTATTVTPIINQTTSQVGTMSGTKTRVGFAVGAGIEKALDAHWSAKAEYLYVDLGSQTFTGTTSTTTVDLTNHIARAGINYRF